MTIKCNRKLLIMYYLNFGLLDLGKQSPWVKPSLIQYIDAICFLHPKNLNIPNLPFSLFAFAFLFLSCTQHHTFKHLSHCNLGLILYQLGHHTSLSLYRHHSLLHLHHRFNNVNSY